MKIVFICFRLISRLKRARLLHKHSWGRGASSTSVVPGSLPSPDCTEVSTVISVSWEWKHRLKQAANTSNYHGWCTQSSILGSAQREKAEGCLLVAMKYEVDACFVLFFFQPALHVEARSRHLTRPRCRKSESSSLFQHNQSERGPEEFLWLIGWLLESHMRVWLLYVTGWMCVFTFTVGWARVLAC